MMNDEYFFRANAFSQSRIGIGIVFYFSLVTRTQNQSGEVFHFAESGVAALWSDLRTAGLLTVEQKVLESSEKLRTHCLTVGYGGRFTLGFSCYWTFPTFHPKHLVDMFGLVREPPGYEETKTRFTQLLGAWRPTAIVSFNGEVFEDLTGLSVAGYTKHIRSNLLRGEFRSQLEQSYPVFQTYPAAWRYHKDAERLRRESLLRIVEAVATCSH